MEVEGYEGDLEDGMVTEVAQLVGEREREREVGFAERMSEQRAENFWRVYVPKYGRENGFFLAFKDLGS